MNLSEVFNTTLNLEWTFNINEHYSEFELDENKYGVSAVEEEIEDMKCIRVDFHYKTQNSISHSSTNFGKNSFKVLAIISNGIKQKFEKCDVIYFIAKETLSDKEFDSRVKLYSRIVDKLKIETDRIPIKRKLQNEYVFALCLTDTAKNKFLSFI